MMIYDDPKNIIAIKNIEQIYICRYDVDLY